MSKMTMGSEPRTICVKCRYHRDRDGILTGVHLCGHPKLTRNEVVSPVTGKRIFVGAGGFEVPYPYCDDVNKGECPHYEERP